MQAPRPPQAKRRAGITPGPSQVRPGWLLGALGLLLLAALFCAYLSLCLLFVQGQWQLLYRPGQHAGHGGTPSDAGLAYTAARFGASQAGTQQLSGWWMPAPPNAPLAGATVLYLHDAAGSLGDTVPELLRLHALGCAVFAIDYRGFGASAPTKISEASMTEDARSAIAFLVDSRHVDKSSVTLWGRGVGATVAADVADPRLPLLLEDANEPAMVLLGRDPRTRLLPLRLLLRDRLDASDVLRESRAPKLFLETAPGRSSQINVGDKGLAGGRDATDDPKAPRDSRGGARLYGLAGEPKVMALPEEVAAIQEFIAHNRQVTRLIP